MRTQRETDLEEEIERLTARNEHLEKRFGYLEGDWERRNHIIESQDKRIAKLESEVKALWLEKIERTNVASRYVLDTSPVDGYCGKRSSKAGLQAGETEHE